jgi:hypothetical protein
MTTYYVPYATLDPSNRGAQLLRIRYMLARMPPATDAHEIAITAATQAAPAFEATGIAAPKTVLSVFRAAVERWQTVITRNTRKDNTR